MICFVYPPTDKIAIQFKMLGNWEEDDFSEEQIVLNLR